MSPGPKPGTSRAAFWRGINVGKAKRLAMADLKKILGGLGCEDPRTLLNSGNAVFRAAGTNAALAQAIESTVERDLGVRSAVTVLTQADLEMILDENPLREAVAEPSRLLISIYRDPSAKLVAETLTRQDWAPDVYAVGERAAYLWCPNGISAGKLPLAVDRALGERGTARNWATLQKIRALLADL